MALIKYCCLPVLVQFSPKICLISWKLIFIIGRDFVKHISVLCSLAPCTVLRINQTGRIYGHCIAKMHLMDNQKSKISQPTEVVNDPSSNFFSHSGCKEVVK